MTSSTKCFWFHPALVSELGFVKLAFFGQEWFSFLFCMRRRAPQVFLRFFLFHWRIVWSSSDLLRCFYFIDLTDFLASAWIFMNFIHFYRTRWDPCVLPEFDDIIAKFIKTLDRTLGYDDAALSRPKFKEQGPVLAFARGNNCFTEQHMQRFQCQCQWHKGWSCAHSSMWTRNDVLYRIWSNQDSDNLQW